MRARLLRAKELESGNHGQGERIKVSGLVVHAAPPGNGFQVGIRPDPGGDEPFEAMIGVEDQGLGWELRYFLGEQLVVTGHLVGGALQRRLRVTSYGFTSSAWR